jgi:hypothetical protein
LHPGSPHVRIVVHWQSSASKLGQADHLVHDSEMPETQIEQWVNLHWQCAAAMLEAGVMDETGEWIEGKDLRRGLEAYRERLLASPVSEAAAVGNDPS